MQNGIGSEEVIARHVPRVIRGVCLPAGHLIAPGVINMDGPGPTWIGPFEPRPASIDEVQRLADALNRAGMPTHARADARGAQWTKLLFNAATNPIAALTGLTHGELCDVPELRAARDRASSTRDAPSQTRSGSSSKTIPLELIGRLAAQNYDHKPSMLQDVLAQRPTEIDALNGGIVREGGARRRAHAAATRRSPP